MFSDSNNISNNQDANDAADNAMSGVITLSNGWVVGADHVFRGCWPSAEEIQERRCKQEAVQLLQTARMLLTLDCEQLAIDNNLPGEQPGEALHQGIWMMLLKALNVYLKSRRLDA